MSFFQNYTFTDTGIPLSSVTDFTSAVVGTQFTKSTGEIYEKTANGIYRKVGGGGGGGGGATVGVTRQFAEGVDYTADSSTTIVVDGAIITNKNLVDVYFDGDYQQRSTYSLSNDGVDTTLTFTGVIPASSQNVEVSYWDVTPSVFDIPDDSISTAKIQDLAVTTAKIQFDAVDVNRLDLPVNNIGAIGGGSQDLDLALGRAIVATVDTAATTFTISNPLTAKDDGFTLYLTDGGSQTVTWPVNVLWAGGTPPTLTAAGLDVLTFTTFDSGLTWHGFLAGADMQ